MCVRVSYTFFVGLALARFGRFVVKFIDVCALVVQYSVMTFSGGSTCFTNGLFVCLNDLFTVTMIAIVEFVVRGSMNFSAYECTIS